jgi:hypothetical protein
MQFVTGSDQRKVDAMEKRELKSLFQSTLTYITFVFDQRTLKEWLKWNRLHMTWGKNKIMHVDEFDAWVKEWVEFQNENISSKE